jgi:hypothetical protein
VIVQLTSVFGAVLILGAYAGSQRGIFTPERLLYLAMNIVGGTALTAAALAKSQWGFVLLEGTWTLISVVALPRALRVRRAKNAEGPGANAGPL